MKYFVKYAKIEILTLVILSTLALWPFFKSGFFTSHDGEWMVIRFTAFHQSLVDGQFPVRFTKRLNNNYGYPVLNFLYPLPFYFSELPKIVGFNFVNSVKVTFVISTLISVLAMYWALSQYFTNKASFTGSVLYLFAPYRFVDLYVRGSLGENMAFAILPLIFGSIFKISKNKQIYFPILSLFVAFLIISHNVIAVLFIPFFVALTFTLTKKNFLKSLVFIAIGIFTSTFFWVPALFDLQFVRLSQIKISEAAAHLVPFSKLIVSRWGYGGVPSQPDGFSAQIGVLSAILFSGTLYLSFKNKQKNLFINFLIAIFLLSVFLISPLSSYIWRNIPIIDTIQFPWRILSLIVFITAIFSAYLVDKINKNHLWILITTTAIISTIIYTKPNRFVQREEGFYTTNESSTTTKDEYLPLWVKNLPTNRTDSELQQNPEVVVENENITGTTYRAQIYSKNNTTITVNTIYFPGHEAFIDNTKANIKIDSESGLIKLDLPAGSHEVIIKYGKTNLHIISESISAFSFIILVFISIKIWRKRDF